MKRLFALLILLSLAGVFAGCNQENAGTKTDAGTNAAPAAPGTNQ